MITSHMDGKPGPSAGPIPNSQANHSHQCCDHKCTCSKIRDVYNAIGNLTTLVIRGLERDTRYAYGPIALSDDEHPEASSRDLEHAHSSDMEFAKSRKLIFPWYWGFLRLLISILSLLTMILFSAFIDSGYYYHADITIVWITFVSTSINFLIYVVHQALTMYIVDHFNVLLGLFCLRLPIAP